MKAAAGWAIKISGGDVNAKRNVGEYVEALARKCSDDSISKFFKQPGAVDRLEPKQCVKVLRVLSSTSLRSSALNYTSDLRNKQQWQKLVSLVAQRAITTRHARHRSIMESNEHFIDLCKSLSKLRIAGGVASLQAKVPHDPSYCFPHVLRYAAEVDDSINDDLLMKAAEQFAAKTLTDRQPNWLPAHLASSLSMLLRNNPSMLEKNPTLSKINAWIWKRSNAAASAISSADMLDLFENYLTFKHSSGLVSNDLFKRLRENYESKPREREVQSSRFQSQVAEALTQLDLPHQQEALNGALDFMVTTRQNNAKLGLQCYGPTHYVFDGSKLEGRTLFREFLLKPLPILHVNFTKWEYFNSLQDKRVYLHQVLTGK